MLLDLRSKSSVLLVLLSLRILLVTSYDFNLAPAKEKYKIMLLLPFSSPSHQIPYKTLAMALAHRGHQITFLTGIPSSLKHKNIEEIYHGVNTMVEEVDLFVIDKNDPTEFVTFFRDVTPRLARELYDVPKVMELYNRRHEFDLFITDDMFNEPGYAFLVGKRYVVLSPFGMLPQTSSKLGNVLNPSYNPSIITDYARPYSFWERVKNLWAHILPAFMWSYVHVVPAVEQELRKRFPDLPPVAEIEKGAGLVLSNIHFTLDIAAPLLPSQIQVGGLHCRPGEKLPQDLDTFLNDSGETGAIYFSLGTVFDGRATLEKYRNLLIQAFGRLSQRVVWKYEGELVDLPDNILIKKWLPQQDILAHPNVKLFITHGGLLSLQESIFHAKPVLALPIFGDQKRNGQRIRNMGIGTSLLWEELTIDLLLSTILDLITNNSYKTAIENVSNNFRDQQLSPLDNAIWWTEYFIRNKGAPVLKSPAADLSWVEYLMIDVVAALLALLYCFYFVIKMVTTTFISLLSSKKSNKKKKE